MRLLTSNLIGKFVVFSFLHKSISDLACAKVYRDIEIPVWEHSTSLKEPLRQEIRENLDIENGFGIRERLLLR